jgi:uncharacterized protein (TIGR02266 family)
MTGTLSEKDLAEFFRVPVYLPVDYDGREMLSTSRISNISQHGCFIATTKPLPLGKEIELRFQLPGLRELMIVPGVVRWSRGSPKEQKPILGRAVGMGVEFSKLSRSQKMHIKNYIQRFITEMRVRKEG